jgi:hypothetical protein
VRRILAILVVLAPSVGAASSPAEDPRFLLSVDLAYLAPPNAGVEGGGGVGLPVGGGTAAGLNGGGGAELGFEARLSRWIALGVGVGWYRPTMEVDRVSPVPDEPIDSRSATVDLRRAQLALVIAPPSLRSSLGRLSFGAFVARSAVSGVPASLAVTVDGGDTGLGADVRGEVYLSKKRHWGIGGALAYSDAGPGFTDVETGSRGDLQVSGFFFRFGLRGSW